MTSLYGPGRDTGDALTRRSGGLRPEPCFTVSALRAPAAIAKECELYATGPDRDLDEAIWLALVAGPAELRAYQEGLAISPDEARFRADYMRDGRSYTASIDAAITLIPAPDWEWSLEIETNSDGGMCARCAMGDPMRFRDVEAKTPALAICAAALLVRDALAAGSRRAKTAQPVECEASQSGPKGIAQPIPPSDPLNTGEGK